MRRINFDTVTELIVTQWDVNAGIRRATSFDDQELIVTQWDVNTTESGTVLAD